MHEAYRLGGRSAGERLKEADDLPALGLGQLRLAGVGIDGAPCGHRRERDAIRDPVLELARRVLGHVYLKVERSRVKRQCGRTVAQTLRPVTYDAVGLKQRSTECHSARIVRG